MYFPSYKKMSTIFAKRYTTRIRCSFFKAYYYICSNFLILLLNNENKANIYSVHISFYDMLFSCAGKIYTTMDNE